MKIKRFRDHDKINEAEHFSDVRSCVVGDEMWINKKDLVDVFKNFINLA